MKQITRKPARLTGAGALVLGVLVAVTVSVYSSLALGLAGLGVVLLAGGLVTASRGLVTVGALGLFAGTVAAGAEGAPVALALFGVVGAVLAYDFAATAIDIGAQLGREADTRRLEAVQLGTTALVGTAVAVVSYLVYTLGSGGQPISAVVGLLLAVVLLLVALRGQRPAD